MAGGCAVSCPRKARTKRRQTRQTGSQTIPKSSFLGSGLRHWQIAPRASSSSKTSAVSSPIAFLPLARSPGAATPGSHESTACPKAAARPFLPGRARKFTMKRPLFAGIAAVAFLSVLFAGAQTAAGAPTAGCHIGGVSTVKADEVAALSKRAYDAAVHASVVHDNVGFQQLMRSGQFVPLNRGARLRILGGDFTHLQGRVVSNPGFQAIRGRVVWVDCSWLR